MIFLNSVQLTSLLSNSNRNYAVILVSAILNRITQYSQLQALLIKRPKCMPYALAALLGALYSDYHCTVKKLSIDFRSNQSGGMEYWEFCIGRFTAKQSTWLRYFRRIFLWTKTCSSLCSDFEYLNIIHPREPNFLHRTICKTMFWSRYWTVYRIAVTFRLHRMFETN